MANPFVKAWKYLMAKLDLTVEENADPKAVSYTHLTLPTNSRV